MRKTKLIITIKFLLGINLIFGQVVSTVAGSTNGFQDGNTLTAKFFNPFGVCIDATGNLFIADQVNYKIRKISAGNVSTLAGSTQGDAIGVGSTAMFKRPTKVCMDTTGNIYLSDTGNHKIKKVTPDGVVSLLAGSTQGYQNGIASSAKFSFPNGLCLDNMGNLYVVELGNDVIRKITPSGIVSTFCGSTSGYADGSATTAQFQEPIDIFMDSSGTFYVADAGNHRIRKVTPTGEVSTLAGSTPGGFEDGAGNTAKFNYPTGVCVDATGHVYVADEFNEKIRKITPSGNVTTLAGSTQGYTDGIGTSAKFNHPAGVAVDLFGNIYVADNGNHKIRKIGDNLSIINNSILSKNLTIYPNPSINTLILENKIEIIKKVEFYDLNSRLIYSLDINSNRREIDVSQLENTIYLLKIFYNESIENVKIIKTK